MSDTQKPPPKLDFEYTLNVCLELTELSSLKNNERTNSAELNAQRFIIFLLLQRITDVCDEKLYEIFGYKTKGQLADAQRKANHLLTSFNKHQNIAHALIDSFSYDVGLPDDVREDLKKTDKERQPAWYQGLS